MKDQPIQNLIKNKFSDNCDMNFKDNDEKLTDHQKKELRIWTENGHVNYYNFKSKKELPKGVSGSVAMVNHRITKWNPDTNRWNFVSSQAKRQDNQRE